MNGCDIISLILSDLSIKAPTFAKEIGVKYQRILDIQTGKTKKISPAVADCIIEKYPQYNRGFLLSGEGNMLNYQVNEVNEVNDPPSPPSQMITISKTEIPVKSYTSGVPYYNVDFLGGFDIVVNDQTIVPEYCIDFKQYNKATCWCDITGHSMEPEINSGDIIALKEIEDFSFLPYGEIYAIITSNGMRTVKRIGPASSPDMYALIPTNKSPEYGVQEIPKEMIVRVFSVLGCMKKL